MAKLRFIMSCFWLCLARTVVSEDLYHKVGGELVLKPDKSTVPGPIPSILWKNGKNKVAEWDKDFGGLDIYASFKERTTLDLTTGELRISGLTKTDSGVYSVEFNGKLLDNTYKLSVIKAVPKPTITSSCYPDKTSCTLTCEGDTTDAEPVTYRWKVGDGAWEVIDKQMNVFKSDTGNSNNGYKYICKLNNAVSGEGEVSEPVEHVFGPEPSEAAVGQTGKVRRARWDRRDSSRNPRLEDGKTLVRLKRIVGLALRWCPEQGPRPLTCLPDGGTRILRAIEAEKQHQALCVPSGDRNR
ncbi:hypothetical protein J4Q44_G00047680 [Coregonus suidteri]|uniref:Ig-like domain-containing protein n=1 Tax=Coregonus suidteri TaxID=861788 RepID=A0AAN8NDW5_9TELE